MHRFILYSILFFSIACTTNKVCRDPNGEEVDWYVIFFMPASASSDGKIHYAYFDPYIDDLEFYEYSEENFPPTQITRYAIEGGKNFNYFFWNDDKTLKGGDSSNAASTKAHAKGSLVYDEDNGAFLLHSLPRFPTRDLDNEILTELPSNGGSYGQTFLCITVDKKNAEQIAKLLSCINVSINKSVDYDRVNKNPNTWINALINNKMDTSCSIQHTVKIKSQEGEIFTFFGKNFKNKIIPYDTTLRQEYNDDFYVRTWSRPALAPSFYDDEDDYFLVNVINIKIGEYGYSVTKEHSKWAITNDKNIVCFSDLNHTESQKERGGHIVCFDNEILHSIMIEAIDTVEEESEVTLMSPNHSTQLFKKKINKTL